jgi:hypothetical protein
MNNTKSKLKLLLALVFGMTIVFGTNSLYAETATEALQSCATAMGYNKLDSFKTMSIKAYMYAQNQKISLKFYQKVVDSNEAMMRFEQSSMGKEDAFVITEEEFFRVKPNYEEMDRDNASEIQMMYGMVMPTVQDVIDDTTSICEIVETTKYNGKSCKKISIAKKDAPTEILQYIYLDAATNWFVGLEAPGGQGGIVTENPKKVKGFVYPSIIKMMQNGKKVFEIEIDKIEANLELDDALFAKPTN